MGDFIMYAKKKGLAMLVILFFVFSLIRPIESIGADLRAPNITNPSSNSTVNKADLTIKWSTVRNAARYAFALRDMTDDVLIIPETKINQTSYQVPASSLIEGHSYKIFVAAEDETGNQSGPKGTWCKYSNFKVKAAPKPPQPSGAPSITYPSSNSTVNKADLTIKWSTIRNTARYAFALRDMTDDVLVIPETKINQTSYQVPASSLIEGHSYKIFVAAEDETGNQSGPKGTWCKYSNFKVKAAPKPPQPSGAPSITNPSSNSTVQKADNAVTNKADTLQLQSLSGSVRQISIKEGEPSDLLSLIKFTGKYKGGLQEDVSNKVVCMPANPTIVKIEGEKITGLKTGKTSLKCKYGNKQIVVTVSVEKSNQTVKPVLTTDPTIKKEVRYLPESDQIYVRADLNPNNGQKTENDWPIVWVGIYDLTSNKILYETLDEKNRRYIELKHVHTNTYEQYIPTGIVPRNHKLKFVFFVDGYNNIQGELKRAKGEEIILTPVPPKTWDYRYNWVTDEIEVIVKPDVVKGEKIPPLYMVAYADGGEALYKPGDFNQYSEIPWYSGTVKEFKGSFARTWTLNELHLKRDQTYHFGVLAQGFEDQWNSGNAKKVVIYPPEIIDGWTTNFDNAKQKICLAGKIKGIPSKWKIQIGTNEIGKWINIPFNYNDKYSGLTQFKAEISTEQMGLKDNNSYGLIIRIIDEKGSEVNRTASIYVSIIKPMVPYVIQDDPLLNNSINRADTNLKKIEELFGYDCPNTRKLVAKGTNLSPKEQEVLRRVNLAHNSILYSMYTIADDQTQQLGKFQESLITTLVVDLALAKMIKPTAKKFLGSLGEKKVSGYEAEIQNRLTSLASKDKQLADYQTRLSNKIEKEIDKTIIKGIFAGINMQGRSVLGDHHFQKYVKPAFINELKVIEQYVAQAQSDSNFKYSSSNLERDRKAMNSLNMTACKSWNNSSVRSIWHSGISQMASDTTNILDVGGIGLGVASAGTASGVSATILAISKSISYTNKVMKVKSNIDALESTNVTINYLKQVPRTAFPNK
jgi:hypothetical protein